METNSTVYLYLFNSTSSIIILGWFEIVLACITYGFGFIGNFLSLIIFFSQDEFRNVSTGVLFLLMTISNTIHLWTLTTEFLSTFDINVYSNVFLQCRLNYFIQNVSRAVSTYLAISIVIDRLIRSEIPIRSRLLCTCRNAIKLTIIYLILFSILCSFWFCPLITINPMTGTCYGGQSLIFTYFLNKIFLVVRFIIVFIIPVIVMSTGNIRMLFNIQHSRRRLQPGNTLENTVATSNTNSVFQRIIQLDRTLLFMMFANVTAFIITQMPFHIYTMIQATYSIYNSLNNSLIRALLLIWSSIYFGIGFYLYCFTSPLFREKFFLMTHKLMNYIRRHRPI